MTSKILEKSELIEWMLEGDISLRFQVYRDLLDIEKVKLQEQTSKEGWGKLFLENRKPEGHWGDRFYQPKWISTHYTLLDLKNICFDPNHPLVQSSIKQVLDTSIAEDGGIQLGPSTAHRSDVCVNGMFLNYASYFKIDKTKLHSIVDSLLNEIMSDGGFNCRTTRSGAKHSSLHSSISVLEGLFEFNNNGGDYRNQEVIQAMRSAEEFILIHRFFLSDRTGEIIKKEFLKFPFSGRWRYNILRALDYFQYAGRAWDDRMHEAISVLMKKRNKNGSWNVQAAHPGQLHFVMEKAGNASRWNTLRAMRIFKHFDIEF